MLPASWSGILSRADPHNEKRQPESALIWAIAIIVLTISEHVHCKLINISFDDSDLPKRKSACVVRAFQIV